MTGVESMGLTSPKFKKGGEAEHLELQEVIALLSVFYIGLENKKKYGQ